MQKVIYYFARCLSVLLVFFFGLFALEIFSPGFSLADALAHLSLTAVVMAAAITAWIRPLIGGWLFVILGIAAAYFFQPLLWNGFLIGAAFCLAGIMFVSEKIINSK